MAVRVASLNLDNGFSVARPDKIYEHILKVEPHVAVFPQAYNEFEDDMVQEVQRKFRTWGYRAITTYYNDRDGRKDRHGLMVIARSDLILGDNLVYNNNTVRLAEGTGLDRSVLRLHMKDPDGEGEFDFYGVDLDKRKETTRMYQTLSLLEYMDDSRPAIIAGGLHNMYRATPLAAFFRALGRTAHLIYQVDPDTPWPKPFIDKVGHWIGQKAYQGRRLGGMAEGRVLELLDRHKFYSGTAAFEATTERDYIFARDMAISDYTVEKPDFGDRSTVTAVVTPVV